MPSRLDALGPARVACAALERIGDAHVHGHGLEEAFPALDVTLA
jgi:hypothetical protein